MNAPPTPLATPIDVPTRETADFIASHLAPGAGLLEIGCGAGHVAAELTRRGFRVTAIDADAASVQRARARGVHAFTAVWPEWESGPFDAVAFTRSLHHIGALDPAVEHARAVLCPRGVLLVEDFKREGPEPLVLEWFVEQLRSPEARALIQPIEGELVTELLRRDPIQAWRARHDRPDLHDHMAMHGAISRSFGRIEWFGAPYFYRYLIPVMPETPEGAAFVEHVLRLERELRGPGLPLVGHRFVARVEDAVPQSPFGTLRES